MKTFVKALRERPVLNVLIILAYFMAVVLPHKAFGTFLNRKVFSGITRAEYNQMVIYITLVAGALIAIWFYRGWRQQKDRSTILFYLGCTILMMILVVNTLFVINIEMVHFPQYAILFILLFPRILQFSHTIIAATIMGAIDEAYQYFYLAPKDTFYYDFNDVVTNLLGAALGAILLKSQGVETSNHRSFIGSGVSYALLGVVLIVATLCMTDILSIYPSEESQFQILRKWPEGFWTDAAFEVRYHIIRPLEGLIITLLLWLFYWKLD